MLKLSAQTVLEVVLVFSLLAVFNVRVYADFQLELKHFSISVKESGSIFAASNEEMVAGATANKIHLVELIVSESQPLILVDQASYTDDYENPIVESTFLRGDGLQIRRLISTDPGEESVLLKYVLSNPSSGPIDLTGEARLRLLVGDGFSSLQDPGGGYGAWLYSFRHPFMANAARAIRLDSDILTAGNQFLEDEWFGWTNRYSAVAIRSLDSQWRFHQTDTAADEELLAPDTLLLELITASQTLLPGDEIQFQLQGLLIPKKRDLLNQDKIQLERLLFMNLWDWFRWLCFGIWIIIDLLFQLCGNWGVTIILLALVIRLVTIPVTRLSLRYQEISMQQQTRIAPLIREIKASYKGLEQSERLIKLYEDEHYDHLAPFKGLIGLFIQIPIFIALFNILGEAFELRGVSFIWIQDLATSDRLFNFGVDLPYFGSYFNLLPFLMAAITVLSTWLAARHSGSAGTHTGTLFGMAGIFFVLFYSFPAALVLYWMFSNLFQMTQQMIENRKAP